MRCMYCGNELGTGDYGNVCWHCRNQQRERGAGEYQKIVRELLDEQRKLLNKYEKKLGVKN